MAIATALAVCPNNAQINIYTDSAVCALIMDPLTSHRRVLKTILALSGDLLKCSNNQTFTN